MRQRLPALGIAIACMILVSCGNGGTSGPSGAMPQALTPQSPEALTPLRPEARTPQKPEAQTPQRPETRSPQRPVGLAPQRPEARTPQARHLHQSEITDSPAAAKVYYRDRVMVLMYHNVKLHSNRNSIITVKQLDEQLSAMRKNGFRFITMDQYMDFILLRKAVPDNAVLLTFDDGYETFYTLVYPLLRKHGATAANFVVVSSIDQPAGNGNTKLTWEQMREMKRAGMSFYNHTYNLHYYAAVDPKGVRRPRPALARRVFVKPKNRMETPGEYEMRVYNDLIKAETRLREELGNTRRALAFPYGVYSRQALDVAHRAGIDVTFTVQPGINRHSSQNGNRINAGNRKMTAGLLIRLLKHKGTL